MRDGTANDSSIPGLCSGAIDHHSRSNDSNEVTAQRQPISPMNQKDSLPPKDTINQDQVGSHQASRSNWKENSHGTDETSDSHDIPQVSEQTQAEEIMQQPTNDDPTANPLPSSLLISLYTTHMLSTFNSRLFETAAVLFLAAIYPGTLLRVSIYALARNAAGVLFSTATGSMIDGCNRLFVIRISILGQRIAVVASCVIFLLLSMMQREMNGGAKSALFILLILLACVEKICSVMNLVSIERDWIVVVTTDRPDERRVLNARMRRIDLFCKLVGPLVISLIDGVSTMIAIWLTLGLNLFSIGIEYHTVRRVYRAVPDLRRNSTGDRNQIDETQAPLMVRIYAVSRKTLIHVFPIQSIPLYIHHPAFLPSFSLSLLYLTVLSFSGQMITYLLSAGYTSTHVGIARAISTIFELSATWLASRLQKHIGPIRGAIWSVNWEALWLTGGMIWFITYGQHQGYSTIPTASGLVAGVILSRVGLWSVDLCTQTVIQEEVEEDQRGAFSTVEAALQNLFELLSYVTTIVFSRPEQFVWPSVISLTAVYVAGGLYALSVRRRRGHLLHRPLCLKGMDALGFIDSRE